MFCPQAVKVAAEEDEDLDIDLSEGDDDGDVPRPRPARNVQEGGYDSDEVDFDSDEAGDEGFVDLSTLLGAGQGFGPPSDDDDDEQEGESASGEEEDDMDMDDDDDDSGSDEDDDEAADRLNSLIAGLPSKRKSAPGESDDEDVGASRAKRRVLKDRNEEGRKEGSFGAPLNASTSALSFLCGNSPLVRALTNWSGLSFAPLLQTASFPFIRFLPPCPLPSPPHCSTRPRPSPPPTRALLCLRPWPVGLRTGSSERPPTRLPRVRSPSGERR